MSDLNHFHIVSFDNYLTLPRVCVSVCVCMCVCVRVCVCRSPRCCGGDGTGPGTSVK